MKRPPYPTVTALMSVAEKAYVNFGVTKTIRKLRQTWWDENANSSRMVKGIVIAVRRAMVDSQMNPTTDDIRRAGLTVTNGVLTKIPNAKPQGLVSAHARLMDYAPVVRQESPLERLFLELWTHCKGTALEREVCLVPDREWRCDFVHERSKVCVELQGFADHASKKGFRRDNEKHWALAKLGYRVITWDRKLVNESNVRELIRICGGWM